MSAPPPDRFDDHDADDDALLRDLGLAGPPRARPVGCPSFAALQAAEAGVLPDEDAHAVAAHLERCAACRVLLDAARAWEGPEPGREAEERIARRAGLARRNALSSWLLPLAAVLALAVLAPLALRDRARPGPVEPTPGASGPAPVLPLEKLGRRSPPSLVLRGEDAYESELAQALDAYEAGELETAAARLAALARRHPEAAGPRLYLGVVHLLRGRPQEAVPVLEEAERSAGAFWGPSVRWYLAVARERGGGDPAPPLRALCGAEGEYRARACAALEALASPRVAP